MSKPRKGQRVVKEGTPLPKPPRKWRFLSPRHIIAVALIAGVALVAYSNTFYAPFQFDDRPNIINNPNIQIKVFSWDRMEQLIKNTYKESIRIFSYFTLALNYYFGEFDVFGYHLVNFIIHVASGIFLYRFVLLTFGLPSLKERYQSISYKVALFTSLIFISHPIQTQSVTYIVQRMTSLAGMFYLLAMVLYIKGRMSSGRTKYFYFPGLLVAYLLGVFSKENAAILPFFIALYEFYFFRNLDLSPRGKKIIILLGGFLLGLLALGFLLWGKRYIELTIAGYQYRTFTLSERVLTQFRVVLYYLTLLIYPHPSRLNLDYDFPTSTTILDPLTTLISIIIVAGLLGYSFWIAKKNRLISFFILWYFGNLVIESSIFPLEMAYEHRLYLPAVGPFVLFGLLAVRGIEKFKAKIKVEKKILMNERSMVKGLKPHSTEIVVLILVVLFLSVGTYWRNKIWNNQIELWTDCVNKSPRKARPHVNLGFAYYESGEYEKAFNVTQRAIQIDPKYANAFHNLGIIYQKMGDLNQAIAMVKKSLEIDPTLTMALYSLGAIYLENKQYVEASETLGLFLKVYPYFPDAHNVLAITYAAQKQFPKAIEEFEWELRVNPYNTLTHLNLGQIYWYEFQNKQKAVYHLKVALMLDPFLPNRAEIRKLLRSLEGLL